MKRFVATVLLVLVVGCFATHCAAETVNSTESDDDDDDDDLANLIVGGFKVSIEEVPYQVAVFRDFIYVCGGTIIGPYWIVTAQHCTPDTKAYRYAVTVGVDIPEDGQRLTVAQVYLPPDNEDGTKFDIALVKLERELQFSSRVGCLAPMPSDRPMHPGTPAYISGYGITIMRSVDTALRAATVALMSQDKCNGFYRHMLNLKPYHFCAGFEGGLVDSCQGDSGGPLMAYGRLVGVTDMGVGCARSHAPGVYIAVGSFYDWLMEIVRGQRTSDEQQLCRPPFDSSLWT